MFQLLKWFHVLWKDSTIPSSKYFLREINVSCLIVSHHKFSGHIESEIMELQVNTYKEESVRHKLKNKLIVCKHKLEIFVV